MKTSGRCALPDRNELHVWHGHVAAEPAESERPTGSGAELAVLSDAEKARSARLVRPGDRVVFIATHVAARRVLASYLGADPAAIRFGRTRCCQCGSTEHGRPRIEWPVTALCHNLSGSGRHWLLAVAVGRPVGVDIESHRRIDIAQMSGACLTQPERAYLESQPAAAQLSVFFRCWTRKEAVLKACGVGLASPLSSLEVRPQERSAVRVGHASGGCPDTWLVQDLPSGPDWSAAVAQPAEQAGPVLVKDYSSL